MKLPLKTPFIGLLFLAVLHFAVIGYAQTVVANSCLKTDVQAAVASAGRRGSVSVPAGSCTWSSTLTLTYGITLTGAGPGKTVITSSGAIPLVSAVPDATAITNGENIEITGFTFDGALTSPTLMNIQGASGITGTKPYRSYLIHDNVFRNSVMGPYNTQVGGCIQSNANGDGQMSGVIYKNTFDRCNILLRIFSNNDTREWSNPAFNHLAYGTADSLYFEDNAILYSSSYDGSDPGWIESGQGAKIVVRFNTWNLANATHPQEIWDIHGFQNWSGTVNSGQTSTMTVEYYNNTLLNMGTYRWINHRGTWGMFFDNNLTGTGGNSIDIYGMSTPGSCPSDISPAPTNYNPLVNNTYFFNNTNNGTNVTANAVSTGMPTHCSVTQNANWWNFNASCTASSCSSGVGVGSVPPTGTCTTGAGYWQTQGSSWNTKLAAGTSGRFYRCASTNTWTLYYTPYTYPHPLRSSSSSTTLLPPSNVSAVVE